MVCGSVNLFAIILQASHPNNAQPHGHADFLFSRTLPLPTSIANITTGHMLWQFISTFKFVRKYICCTNPLPDLAYANVFAQKLQPHRRHEPILVAHKTLTKSSTYVKFVIKFVGITNLTNISNFRDPLNN